MKPTTNTTEHQGESSVNRRAFLTKAATVGIGLPFAGILGTATTAFASEGSGPTPSDIAVLKFLAAAEFVEEDLWGQYCELATNNSGYRDALRRIDVSLPAYICQDHNDERSHAALINAYLQSIGETPINLDGFRTIMPPKVHGIEQKGRLTNLTNLKVDTSWYNRYRGLENPDLDGKPAQIVTIAEKPTIPLSDKMSKDDYQLAAHAAAFHFCAIEQGGSSLYVNLIPRVTSMDTLTILTGIGPTEVMHFGVFQTALEGIFGLRGNGLDFPNLRANRELAEKVMPSPTPFLKRGFPACSVIRPGSKANVGPLAAATGLAKSGLFEGQGKAFFDAVVGLATAADEAVRKA
jgi:hypothetical protein